MRTDLVGRLLLAVEPQKGHELTQAFLDIHAELSHMLVAQPCMHDLVCNDAPCQQPREPTLHQDGCDLQQNIVSCLPPCGQNASITLSHATHTLTATLEGELCKLMGASKKKPMALQMMLSGSPHSVNASQLQPLLAAPSAGSEPLMMCAAAAGAQWF